MLGFRDQGFSRGLEKKRMKEKPTRLTGSFISVELGAKPSEMKAVHQHLGSYEILSVLPSTARKAAEILRLSSRKPHRGEWADAVIAATALLNDLTLVTFNTRHYQYPGLSLYPMKDLV
jgi:predicted nucleic acid-binding protein